MLTTRLLFAAAAAPDSLKSPLDSVDNAIKNIVTDVANGEGLNTLSMVLKNFIEWNINMGGRVVGAIILFIVGRYLIKLIGKLLRKLLSARAVDPGVRTFLLSFANTILMLLLIIAIMGKLGIETTSFAALLASFGVAIGMAMSGNLSNFVGGMLILLFKPYRVGDLIKVGDTLAHVIEIQIFHTVLRTYNGMRVYMANGGMSTATIINYSREGTLRNEFSIGIDYGEDFAKVEKVLLEIAHAEKRVLPDPAPRVSMEGFGDNSVTIMFRVWVKKEDYWNSRYDIFRAIYEAFNREGINFPYPQITIHQSHDE